MRIAITYDIDTKEVGQHFGQTQNFLLVDIDGDERKEMVITNGGYSHHELVGYLKDLEVEVLIAGGMGNHAIEFLRQAGIKGEMEFDEDAIHLCDCHHNEA